MQDRNSRIVETPLAVRFPDASRGRIPCPLVQRRFQRSTCAWNRHATGPIRPDSLANHGRSAALLHTRTVIGTASQVHRAGAGVQGVFARRMVARPAPASPGDIAPWPHGPSSRAPHGFSDHARKRQAPPCPSASARRPGVLGRGCRGPRSCIRQSGLHRVAAGRPGRNAVEVRPSRAHRVPRGLRRLSRNPPASLPRWQRTMDAAAGRRGGNQPWCGIDRGTSGLLDAARTSDGNVAIYHYDAARRLIQEDVTEPGGGFSVRRMTHDAMSQPTRVEIGRDP